MAALKALLLSDGRPGHYRLAEGILAAVARRREVETTRLDVHRRSLVPSRVVSHLINAGLSEQRLLSLVYGFDAGGVAPCDLVVSAGGNTLGANIALARVLGADNIFYGSLRRYRAEDFSLVLTSYAGMATAPNQMMALKPSVVDPDLFERRDAVEPGNGPRVGGLIIGGDGGTVHYGARDWERLYTFVDACHSQNGMRWVVSNSARTPGDVSDALARRASGGDGGSGSIASFIDVRVPGAATLKTLMVEADVVVCTADSSSMLSECVWARKSVVAVSPEWFSLPDNERGYRDWLSGNGWVRELAIGDLTPDLFMATSRKVSPLSGNPLDRLAGELERRLPSLFA